MCWTSYTAAEVVGFLAVADLREGMRDTRPNYFNFMQFLEKKFKNSMLNHPHPPSEGLRPTSCKSWIRHCLALRTAFDSRRHLFTWGTGALILRVYEYYRSGNDTCAGTLRRGVVEAYTCYPFSEHITIRARAASKRYLASSLVAFLTDKN